MTISPATELSLTISLRHGDPQWHGIPIVVLCHRMISHVTWSAMSSKVSQLVYHQFSAAIPLAGHWIQGWGNGVYLTDLHSSNEANHPSLHGLRVKSHHNPISKHQVIMMLGQILINPFCKFGLQLEAVWFKSLVTSSSFLCDVK